MTILLGIKSREFAATDEEVVGTMMTLADGSLTEAQLTRWIRNHVVED